MTPPIAFAPFIAAVAAPVAGPSTLDMARMLAPAGIALDVLAVLAIVVLVLGRDRRPPAARPRTSPGQGAPLAPWRMLPGTLGALLAVALGGTPASAQGDPDHLQCYRVTDATLRRLRGTVDLEAPAIGVAPGCKLSKAKLYCVPARQQVRPGTLFDGVHPVTEVPYHGRPAETDRICYQVRCPPSTAADQIATDRFGTHALRRLATDMVCTPATGGTLPPPAQGFQVTSPPIEISPGQDVTYCYYFRTPNLATLAVKRWASALGPAGRGLVFFTTTQGDLAAERRPAGELSVVDCELFASTPRPNWRYAGYGPSDELAFPADDGDGHPVAMEIPPTSAGVLMIHFKNETGAPVVSSATLNAEALDDVVYTPTATLLSYDGTIAVPPQTTGHVETQSCAVPAGARFWNLSTFAHKQAVRTNVLDGSNVVFESFDWAHPGAHTLPAPPFYSFASGTFTHRCTYDNPTTRTITRGPSQQFDEQCLGVGYFFPASKPRLCYNGFVLP
jgi:hypothetical protein